MATLELILLLLAAVLVSSVLDQVIPKLTSPLIQIILGVAIAIIAQGHITITLDPDLFLVVFIAPLLYNEAQEADKTLLWKNRGAMLSYAIGLVVVIMLGVGFAVHALVPSVPLAAALALGAALGPTDAVAVTAISKDADIPRRQGAILQGEALLNDATGIVSFQFALAAAMTGTFALGAAVESFLVEFFGGILLGIVLGWVVNLIRRTVRDWGLDNTTFHVLLDVFTPFIVYLIGNSLHVSGVLCVVACGIVVSLSPQNHGPTDSRLNIVSSSVWRVISYALNGIVFVLLGTQLPNALGNTWSDTGISNLFLTGLIVLITLIMYALRLIWSLGSERHADRRNRCKRPFSARLRAAAITTLSGAKGTITLAIMFTIPYVFAVDGVETLFPERNLLIFLASGVIVLTLVMATFIVPLLAPRTEAPTETAEKNTQEKIEILRRVIEEITARQTDSTRVATAEVVRQYNERIARVESNHDIEEPDDMQLRLRAIELQREYVIELLHSGEIPTREGVRVANNLARSEALIRNEKNVRAKFARWWHRVRAVARAAWVSLRRHVPSSKASDDEEDHTSENLRLIEMKALAHVIEHLQTEMTENPQFPTEVYSDIILELQHTLASVKRAAPSITAYTSREAASDDVRRLALHIETEEIMNAYDEGRLTRQAAQNMRRNVYLMQLDLDDYV